MRAQLIELTPGEPHAVTEMMMIEQALHDRLAIVERALDGERMHIRLARVVIMRRCTSEMRPCG